MVFAGGFELPRTVQGDFSFIFSHLAGSSRQPCDRQLCSVAFAWSLFAA